MDKSHLDEVVNLAHSLISGGHNGAHIIQEHEDTLNARYTHETHLGGGGTFLTCNTPSNIAGSKLS